MEKSKGRHTTKNLLKCLLNDSCTHLAMIPLTGITLVKLVHWIKKNLHSSGVHRGKIAFLPYHFDPYSTLILTLQPLFYIYS